MKEFVKKILLLGYSREDYEAIKNDILQENRNNVIIYSLIIICGMSILLFHSMFVDVLESSRMTYVFAIVVALIILLVAKFLTKKNKYLTIVCQYTLIIALLSFGLILGTIVEPNEASASYAILIVVAPLLFTDLPFRINIVTIISIITYIIAAKATQSETMFSFNMSIILPYGSANLVLTHFTSKQKIERRIYAYRNKLLSEMDQLTNLPNRRSFENDVEKILKLPTMKIGVCSFDVNYLKITNDTLGHKAGDELLIGASKTIEKVLGTYGKCYRVGGDEFAAIIDGVFPSEKELIKAIDEEATKYKSIYNFKLSIASGIAVGENKNIDTLIVDADDKMYLNKRRNHNKTNKNKNKNVKNHKLERKKV